MDEVLFHLSQKIESLQVVLYSALQNSTLWLEVYSEQGRQLVLSAWNSPRLTQVQDIAKNTISSLLDFVRELSNKIVQCASSNVVFNRVSTFVSTEWDQRSVYASCLGFAVGTGFGIMLGLCLQSPPTPHSYMKAVAVTNFTGIDAVNLLEDVVAPVIYAPDDVLVQVKAASVDPVDIKISSGYARNLRSQLNRYNPNVKGELPLVLGRDMAGVVIEIGSGVSRLEVGDEIWCAFPPWSPGTLSELVVTKEYNIGRKPRTLGFEGAASLPYSGSLAWDAVVNKAKLSVKNAGGKRVLVHCGSTGIGCLITQLTHVLGAHVTVTCLNRAASVMTALGADVVYALETADVEKQLLKCERFDIVFNTAGSVAHNFCLGLCTPEGVVITTVAAQLPSDSFGIFLGSLYSLWIRIVHGIFGTTSWGNAHLNHKVLDELSVLVDSGRLQPVVDKILLPHEAEKAFQHIDSAHSIGKTVIRFSGSTLGSSQGKPDILV